jgi:hypothetical protein
MRSKRPCCAGRSCLPMRFRTTSPVALSAHALARLGLGLIYLFAVAAVFSGDKRGRRACLLAGWAGIVASVGNAVFVLLVVRNMVPWLLPALAERLCAGCRPGWSRGADGRGGGGTVPAFPCRGSPGGHRNGGRVQPAADCILRWSPGAIVLQSAQAGRPWLRGEGAFRLTFAQGRGLLEPHRSRIRGARPGGFPRARDPESAFSLRSCRAGWRRFKNRRLRLRELALFVGSRELTSFLDQARRLRRIRHLRSTRDHRRDRVSPSALAFEAWRSTRARVTAAAVVSPQSPLQRWPLRVRRSGLWLLASFPHP